MLHNSIKTEIAEAKQKEIALWKQGSVYIEVSNEGQRTIFTRLVASPDVTDGQMSTKANLVARGFEEDHDIRSDSFTGLPESVRLCSWH